MRMAGAKFYLFTVLGLGHTGLFDLTDVTELSSRDEIFLKSY